MHTLDILIPAYNEGPNIVTTLELLRRNVKTPSRALICYDFEEDDTLAALRGYRPEGFEVVLVKNRGTGVHAAVRSGFQASTAPAVLVFPADDHQNAGMIDQMVRRFDEGCDVVVSSRLMPGGRMEGYPALKRVLVRTCAWTLRRLAGLPTHDPTNGFRLFSRRLLQAVELESSQGFTYSIELLVKCHRLGWKIGEVPEQWVQRQAGSSKFRLLKWLPAYLRWYGYAFATTYLRTSHP